MNLRSVRLRSVIVCKYNKHNGIFCVHQTQYTFNEQHNISTILWSKHFFLSVFIELFWFILMILWNFTILFSYFIRKSWNLPFHLVSAHSTQFRHRIKLLCDICAIHEFICISISISSIIIICAIWPSLNWPKQIWRYTKMNRIGSLWVNVKLAKWMWFHKQNTSFVFLLSLSVSLENCAFGWSLIIWIS